MAIVDDDHFLHYYISLYNEEALASSSSSSPPPSSSEYNNNDNIKIINSNNVNSDDKINYHAKFSREYLVCQYQSLSSSKRHHKHFHHHHRIGELRSNVNDNKSNNNANKNNKNNHNSDNMNDEETTTSCTRSSISSSSQPFSTTSSETDSDTNSDGQWDMPIKDKTDSDTNSCDDNEVIIKTPPKMMYRAADAHDQDMYRMFNDFQNKHITVSFVTNPAVLDSLFINANGYDSPSKLVDIFKKLTKNKIFSHELSYEEIKHIMNSEFPELPWMKDMYPASLYEVLLARIELSMWTSYYRILEHHNFKLPQTPGKAGGILSINKSIKKDEESRDDALWMITSKSPLVILPSWSVIFATACSIEELKETWEKLTSNIQNDILGHCPFLKIFYFEALRNKAPLSFLERLVHCPLQYVCIDRAVAIKNEYDYIGNYKSESTVPPPDIFYHTIDDIVPKSSADSQLSSTNPAINVRCIAKPPDIHPSLSGLKHRTNGPADRVLANAVRAEALEEEVERSTEARMIDNKKADNEKIDNEDNEIENKIQQAERIEAIRIEAENAEAEKQAIEERRKKKIKEKKKKQAEKKKERERSLAAEIILNKESVSRIHSEGNDACSNVNNDDHFSNGAVHNNHSSNDNNDDRQVILAEETNYVDNIDDHFSSDNDDRDVSCEPYDNGQKPIDGNTSKDDIVPLPLNKADITYSVRELYSLRDAASGATMGTSRISNIVTDDVADADNSFNSDYYDTNQNYQQLPTSHTTFYRNNNYDFKSLEKRLTRNIRNYNHIMNNRMEAHKLARLAVTLELRSIVSSLWPQATLCVYGSCITGLALPTSDIDFVVKLTHHYDDFYNHQKYVPAYYHLNQSSSATSSATSSPLSVPPMENVSTIPDTYYPTEANNTFCQAIVGDIAERAYLEANPLLQPVASLSKLPPRYLGHSNGDCPNQQEVLNALFALTAQLNMQHWTASVNPIPTAAVPVIKMQALPEHLLCLPHIQTAVSPLYYEEMMYQKSDPPPFHLTHGISIPVDISIEAGEHKGISSCEFIQYALRMRSPVMTSVVKVVKGLLQQAGYNMPFNGGLSSYSIFIMVCAIYDLEMIQEVKRLAAKDTTNPNYVTDTHITLASKSLTEGTLFLNFLRFFSHQFDPSVSGIDITNPSIIFQLSSEQHALIGTSVWLSNPFDQSNIARPSFAFKQIQYLFGLMLHSFESNFRHMQLHHHQLHQHSTSNSKSNNEYADENLDFIRMYISF